ncbi:MAG: hypothetical protein Q9204_004068, partial [Flavoplaca sp. TL-2023a]
MWQAATDDTPGVVAEAAKADDASFEDFVKLMHKKMPLEIIKDIEEWLYEIVFCPGYLYVHSPKQQYACCPLPTDKVSARPALLCLSRNIKTKYETRMWSENTWVVHVGLPVHAVHFVDQLPTEAKNFIKRVHLKFGHLGTQPESNPTTPSCIPVPYFVYAYPDPKEERPTTSDRTTELLLRYLLIDLKECHGLGVRDNACLRATISLGAWPMEKTMPEVKVLASTEKTKCLREFVPGNLGQA